MRSLFGAGVVVCLAASACGPRAVAPAQVNTILGPTCENQSVLTKVDALVTVSGTTPTTFERDVLDVTLTPGVVSIGGVAGTGATMAERVASVWSKPTAAGIAVQITPEVPTAEVTELVAALAGQGAKELTFVVATDTALPAVTLVDATFAEELGTTTLTPEQRQEAVAKRVAGLVESCPGIGPVFFQSTQVAPVDRCTTVARGLAEALPSCPKETADQVLTLIQRDYASDLGVRRGGVTVTLTAGETPWTLEGATWGTSGAAWLASSPSSMPVVL